MCCKLHVLIALPWTHRSWERLPTLAGTSGPLCSSSNLSSSPEASNY